MLPRLAIVDPELTAGLPPALTASTGLDALTQLIEPYVSIRANPLSDGFCTEGIRRVARALRPAFHDGADAAAREDMALASLLGGLALANAGLGAVHGFAAPIGGMFSRAARGRVRRAAAPRHGGESAGRPPEGGHRRGSLGRYANIARLLTGDATRPRPKTACGGCAPWSPSWAFRRFAPTASLPGWPPGSWRGPPRPAA